MKYVFLKVSLFKVYWYLMKIIGISGTNGSGKDTVGQILQEDHGYLFISVTDILRSELEQNSQSVERENMRALGDRWRREIGVGVLVDKAIELYKAKPERYRGLVISSIRNVGEVEHIHKLDGIVVWVDAEPEIRYQRVTGRNRSAEDAKSYEEFLGEEQAEMNAYGDSATLNMSEVKKLCDIFVKNNSDSAEKLKTTVEHALRNYI